MHFIRPRSTWSPREASRAHASPTSRRSRPAPSDTSNGKLARSWSASSATSCFFAIKPSWKCLRSRVGRHRSCAGTRTLTNCTMGCGKSYFPKPLESPKQAKERRYRLTLPSSGRAEDRFAPLARRSCQTLGATKQKTLMPSETALQANNAIGAAFLSIFGAVWLAGWYFNTPGLSSVVLIAIVAGSIVPATFAVRLFSRNRRAYAGYRKTPRSKRSSLALGAVNTLQWVSFSH